MKNIFLISLLLFVTGGELGKIHLTEEIAIYLHDFLLIAYLLFNFNKLKRIIKKLKKINKINKKILFLLILNVFLAIIYAIYQNRFQFTSFLYMARALAYFLFILLLKTNFNEKKILNVFLSASFLILILGLLQYFLLPDLTSLYHLGYDDHFYRLASTLLDPNFTGLILVFNCLYYFKRKNLDKKNIFLALLFLVGLALTYSRASYLSLLLASIYLISNSQKITKLFIALCLLLFIILIPFLPQKSGGEGVNLTRVSSISARMTSAKQYLSSNRGPTIFFGQGPFSPQYQINQEGNISHARFADNFLIFLYNGFGIFGTSLILLLLIREFKQQWGRKQHWQISLVIALLVHSLFNNNMTQAITSLTFWAFYL